MGMLMSVGLMAGLALAVQQVETPNYKEPEGGAVTASRAASQGMPKPNVLSDDDRSPSRIGMDEIPEVAVILGQFDSNVDVAKTAGAETYLNVGDGYFSAPGCRYYGQHPFGVARLSDGKFNGAVALLQCNGYVMQVEISDFSQPTSPEMKATLPAARAIPVAGGAMTSSFAETKDGRLRQDHYAIGASTSVKVLVQSDRPIFQDEARAAALKTVEYVRAHPPGIRP